MTRVPRLAPAFAARWLLDDRRRGVERVRGRRHGRIGTVLAEAGEQVTDGSFEIRDAAFKFRYAAIPLLTSRTERLNHLASIADTDTCSCASSTR